MANGFESQKIDRTSIDDLLRLVQGLGQMGAQQESYRRKGADNMYKEFEIGGNSFDNSQVQESLNNMNQYFSENSSKMSSDEIDKHNMLKEKLEGQITRNNQFDGDNQRRFDFGNRMMDFADEYTEANNVRSFSWKTSHINDNGEMVEEDNIVSLPSPEDYEGGENNPQFQKDNNKAIADLGGLDAYNRKREEYKRHLKNQIQRQIGEYGGYQEEMIQKYGASGRLTNFHLKEFQELDESYAFIVDSMNDDGLFDDEERQVYQSAIMQKSSRPIEQFIKKDNEIKTSNRNQLLKEMQVLKSNGDLYAKDLDSVGFATLASTDEELLAPAITLEKNSPYNQTNSDITYTNQEIKEAMANPKEADANLYNYITSLESNIAETKKLLKNKDDAFMKNDGGSFLQGIEQQGWTTGLHDIPTGYQPKIYGEQKSEPSDKKGDEKVDEKITSPPKYSISLDASTKIEKAVSKSLSSNEHDKSIKTSNFLNRESGEKIDIISYDKDNNIYTDSKGNKFPGDAIIVSSIDEIEPIIKSANGKPYYFNPMTNKVEEWGSNDNYKRQKIEKMTINGKTKNVPVISRPGSYLYWIDGKWKTLGKTPYIPSWKR